MRKTPLKLVIAITSALLAGPTLAATCQNTGNFESWLEQFKKDAAAQGISPKIIAAASPYMKFEQRIVNRDRAQGVFNLSFLKFSDRLLANPRLPNGEAQMRDHAELFARVEKQFGVPAPILTAFWGLESDFGRNTGNSNIFAALATLAYDCRRPDYFRPQLMDALRIVQRGDLQIDEMLGGDWAGELGAMQFTASDYYKNAVDYDGDGKRNLVKSVPDTIASAANFLKNLGWKAGEPWLQEVRLTKDLPWDQADLTIQLPRSQWVTWGVRAAHGPLPSDGMKASLLLPMGRKGPAFLAYDNFQALLGWNSSMVYVTTVAYFATRLAGAPPVNRGDPNIEVMQPEQVSELQRILIKMGNDIGEPDGKIGAKTRMAIKKAQMKVGLPADSYPTTELLERLRGGRASAN
ncbi:MAG TPA: lytic murein transglycosylase [Pseudolabrys sp.]|jgi:lytic murein transglycosylase|nr:lytic murein transglycosylase [Pseudolabrys sp.]